MPAGQDALYGRDAYANDDSDGVAGFSFTKLDDNGDPLADQTVAYGTEPGQAVWACVRDNVTGLIWEVKTNSGLQDTDSRYTWYDSDGGQGGDPVGVSDGGTCSGASGCDTERFVADVNGNALCGATDWRLPTLDELIGIVHFGTPDTFFTVDIDTGYFPNASAAEYWSSSRSAVSGPSDAWLVDFGIENEPFKTYPVDSSKPRAVRLVRDGP